MRSSQYSGVIEKRNQQIQLFFKDPLSAYHYLTFQEFRKHFNLDELNFKDQNRNIIDIHLRFRWYVREKMAPYKWVPILFFTPLLFSKNLLLFIIPYAYVNLFDRYFERFFVWRHQRERIINMRHQFITKLSKEKNKLRRINLFEKLQYMFRREKQENELMKKKEEMAKKEGQDKIDEQNPDEEEKLEPPLKYIKFGDFTQYIFHTNVEGKEESTFLQTSLFESYLNFKSLFSFSGLGSVGRTFRDFAVDWIAYRKDPCRSDNFSNLKMLIDNDNIKAEEVYSLQDNFDHNVRRFAELWRWMIVGTLKPSTFKSWQYGNFTEYEDIFDPISFNIKDNNSDLLLYYSVLAIPKLFSFLFRKR